MEHIEYAGPNGYTMVMNVMTDIEKEARANTTDVCGIHRCFSKIKCSRRSLGYNPNYKNTSQEVVMKMTPEHLAILKEALEKKRARG